MGCSVTLEIDDRMLRSLDQLADRRRRSRNELVAEALRDYLDLQEWQTRKIAAGLAAAEQGDFATGDEIARIAAKYAPPP